MATAVGIGLIVVRFRTRAPVRNQVLLSLLASSPILCAILLAAADSISTVRITMAHYIVRAKPKPRPGRRTESEAVRRFRRFAPVRQRSDPLPLRGPHAAG